MVRFAAILITFLLVVSDGAFAAKRVALVIGNSAYEYANPLPNPKNDASDIAASLQDVGFEVVSGIDLALTDFAEKVSEFRKKLRGADVGLFFYAGHGIQVHGQNYLVPVDAELEDETSLDFETVPIHTVLKLMERETKTNLVFLDACRDNPLARNLARSMGTRSTALGRGLARVESGLGTMISFATQPGNVALDGDGKNSPFATGMLRHLKTPGLDVEIVMRRVREDVIKATGGSQVPWSNSSLTGSFIFNDRADEKNAALRGVDPLAIELAFWQAAKDADTQEAYDAYLKKYPEGTFAPMAGIQLKELEQARTAEAKRQAELAAAKKKQAVAEKAKKEAVANQRAQTPAVAKKKAAEEAERRKAEAEQRQDELAALEKKQAKEREQIAKERDELAARLKALEEQAKAQAKAKLDQAKDQQVASLQPANKDLVLDEHTMTLVLQNELRRVGCDPGKVDGKWGRNGRAALAQFNVHAQMDLSLSNPTMETIAAVKSKHSQVCPAAAPARQVTTPTSNTNTSTTPTVKRTATPTKTTCRSGNMAHCKIRCSQGSQRACDKLIRNGR